MTIALRNSGLARDSTARFGLAPVDSTALARILAVWRKLTERSGVLAAIALSHQPSFGLESGPPTRRRTVPFDRVHQLAVLASRALHMNRDEGVQRRNQEKGGEDKPEEKAGHDQDDVEDGRERLAVQQEGERRNENCEQVDHWPNPA